MSNVKANQPLPSAERASVRTASAPAPRQASRRRGQGFVEYALIILFVAIAVILALSLLAPTINSIFRSIPPAL